VEVVYFVRKEIRTDDSFNARGKDEEYYFSSERLVEPWL